MIHLLSLANFSIFEQLQLEEALLRCDKRNWCLINLGSPPAIVMGISGLFEELVEPESDLPLIRRFSGGGTVVVDQETCFFSLICNRSEVPVQSFPQAVLEFNGGLYREVLPESFSIRENDYLLAERKFGGNAQYFTKQRWVHHSSLLWDYCPERMKLLKLPKKMPRYREGRSHTEFLCSLKEALPSKEALVEGFLKGLSRYFSLREANLGSVRPLLELPHRKATKKDR